MEDPLCAVCIHSTGNTSALITYIPPDASKRVIIHERGPSFVQLLQRIEDGLHPDFEPAGRFEMNHEPMGKLRAITTVGGTAVCAWHIDAVLNRRTAQPGRAW